MTSRHSRNNYLFLRILGGVGLAIYYALALGYFQVIEILPGKQTLFYIFLGVGVAIWMTPASLLVVRKIKGTLNTGPLILGLLVVFALLVISVYGMAGKYSTSGYSTDLFVTIVSHLVLLTLMPVAAGLILLSNLGISSRVEEDSSGSGEENEKEPLRNPSRTISLEVGQGKPPFQIPIDNLLLVEAADNYCKFNYLKQDELQTELVRIKLKEVEDILQSESFIFRCHRSYLVNGHFVKSISGSSQNHRLVLGYGLDKVKVSRLFDLDPIHQLMKQR